MQLQDSLLWPPQPKDLEPEKFTLPNKLNLIMKSLLNDKDEQSSRTNRLRYSLGQDIIYAATKGRVRTHKSILLPSVVKTLTNNTELINILNRLGYRVSYSLLMEARQRMHSKYLMSKLFLAALFQKSVKPILSQSTLQTTLIAMRRLKIYERQCFTYPLPLPYCIVKLAFRYNSTLTISDKKYFLP